MENPPMDNQELIRENTLLRQKIQELEHLKVECKHMEKAIRESEERYSMLSQSSFVGIIISEKGMILDANDQLTNMLGYELSDLIGRDGFDLILPERRESFRQHILSGSESPSQIPVIRKDGSLLHVEMRTKAHHTEGRIVRLTALHDITDRLQAEEALQRSHAELERLVAVRTEELMRVNEKLRIEVADHKLAEKALRQEQQFSKAVINSLPGIFFLYSYPECRLLLWNKQHEALLGYSFEELNGRYVTDFHSPEVKDSVMNAIEAMMKTGQGSVEDVLVTKDGRPIPFFSTAVKFESQDKSYFMGICTDMTAHKRAEAELHEAIRRQYEIIEHLPDATFVIDTDGKVVAWNRAIERMTGILKEEMMGKGNYEYAIPFYGERRPIIIDMAFLPDEEFEKREYDVVRRIADTLYGEVYVPKTYGGKGAYLSATASRLRNAAGNVTGAIECIRDITERKHFEKTLRENEEKFSKAFHTSPYAITITSPKDGKFVDVNEGFILITGFTREEALANSSIGLKLWVNEDDRQRVVADLRAGRAVVGQEIHFRTKSDEIITGLFSAQTIQLSNGPCILSSINDISERKRAGEEKAKLEGQLQQAQKMESVGRLAGGVAHDFNNLLGVILGHAEMALDRVDQAETVHADLEEIRKAANRSADLTRQLLAFARQQVVAPKYST